MSKQSNLYILSYDKTTQGILSNRMPFSLPFYDDLQERSLDDYTDNLTFKVPANHKDSGLINADNYILYPEKDGSLKLYKIQEVSDSHEQGESIKEVYAELSAQDDLIKDVVRPLTFTSATLETVVTAILNDSDWSVGQFEDFGLKDYEIKDYPTKLQALIDAFKEYGAELDFFYETQGTTVTGQKVNAFSMIGKDTGKPFMVGKDIKGVQRIENRSKLVTAMIGIGKEVDGVPLTFSAETASQLGVQLGGFPVGFEKPNGVDYVGNLTALNTYSKNGKHIYGVYKDTEAQSSYELFKNTYEALITYSKPMMTYQVTVILLEKMAGYAHEAVELGDTVMVQDKQIVPELYTKARIRKLSRSITQPDNDSVELGDYIPVIPTVNKTISEMQSKIRENEETWNKANEIDSIKDGISQLPTKENLQVITDKQTQLETSQGEVVAEVEELQNFRVNTETEITKKLDIVAYNAKVQELNADIASKAGLEYVNGQLVSKADAEDVTALVTDIAKKADVTYVDGQLVGKASTADITALNTEIAKKAGLTYVDGKLVEKANVATTYTKTQVDTAVNGKVSTTVYNTDKNGIVSRLDAHDTAITQNDTEIALKASQATVDAIAGRVTNAEASLTVQAGQIATKVTGTEVDTKISDVKNYVQSRGENLVTNGTGLLGDNTNFSQFTFDGSQVFAGGGSFFTALQNGTKFNDEFIAVDTTQKYRFSLMSKSKTGQGNNYFGITSYDIDRNVILPYSFYGSKFNAVELTKDLKVGDTVIHVSDVSQFIDTQGVASHFHSIAFWGYKNSYGYEYPVGTYTRNYFTSAWNNGAIDRINNTITLNKPFNVANPNDAQGIYRAGHKVSPTQSGSNYQYMTASNVKVPTEWTKFEGTITGNGTGSNDFPHGTGFVKLLFLVNRSTSGGQAGDSLWVNAVEFTNLAMEDNAKKYSDDKLAPVISRVTTAETAITQTKNDITLKADKTTVDTLQTEVGKKADGTALTAMGTRVTTAEGAITANATAITQRVLNSTYTTDKNGIISRLDTAEASITTQAGQIALKAEKSSVDAIDGRVKTAEASLTVQAGQIATKVTQSAVDTGVASAKTYADGKINPLTTRVANTETAITQTATDIALKADKSTVDTIKTDVGNVVTGLATANSAITANATQIGLRATTATVNTLTGRVATAEGKITTQANEILLKVTKAEAENIAQDTNRIGFRYVRYLGKGNSVNMTTATLLRELKVNLRDGSNVALGKTVTSGEATATGLANLTDGSLTTSTNIGSGTYETQWARVDLGQVYEAVNNITLWHDYTDLTKEFYFELQVSVDGINWITIYDTDADGSYKVSSAGFTFLVNQQRAVRQFATEIRQNSEAIASKADAYIVDDLGTRLSSAEELITPQAIITTVMSEESSLPGILAEKANQSDVDGKADKSELEEVKTSFVNNFATKTELEQNSEKFDFKFSNGGGVNLLKNSVGFAGQDFWINAFNTEGVTGIKNEALDALGIGSGFHFVPSAVNKGISQDVYVEAGVAHTLSWYLNKLTKGADSSYRFNIQIQEDGVTKYNHTDNFAVTTNGYELSSVTYTPVTNKIRVSFIAYANAEAMVTGIMLNKGDVPLQWSMATGEVYNSNVIMDANGIKVKSSGYEGYTHITPEEFAGYYNDNGVEQKVFSLNKDVTEVAKLDVQQELRMSPIKVVPIKSDTLNGWAFVIDEE